MQISVNGLLFGYGHNVSHVVSNGYLVHAHPFPEIYYFLQGDVDVLLSGVEYHMAPHTLMLYPPGRITASGSIRKRPMNASRCIWIQTFYPLSGGRS